MIKEKQAMSPRIGKRKFTSRAALTLQRDLCEGAAVSSSGATEVLGLCRSCDGHRSCAQQKPAGGVWACSRYTDTYESVYE